MSRATLVDPQPEVENADDINEEANETQYVEEQTEQPQEQSTVPEKYQGKSLEEVVQMHQEAEKLLGRQSGEVGELRKVVDDYISSQTPAQAPQQTVEPEEDIDYFNETFPRVIGKLREMSPFTNGWEGLEDPKCTAKQ